MTHFRSAFARFGTGSCLLNKAIHFGMHWVPICSVQVLDIGDYDITYGIYARAQPRAGDVKPFECIFGTK